MKPYSIVVLISGNGSTLQAIIDAISAKRLAATIVAVISSMPQAYGLQRAQQAHIPTHSVSPTAYVDRPAYDNALREIIDSYQPDLIVLAGFMRILTPAFVAVYAGQLINIHPALLPEYRGTHTHTRVLENHEPYHGTSVHFVTAELDGGPLIAQVYFPVAANTTVDVLEQQVHTIEHQLYPLVLQWFATRQLQWNAEKNKIDWLNPALLHQTANNYIKLTATELDQHITSA